MFTLSKRGAERRNIVLVGGVCCITAVARLARRSIGEPLEHEAPNGERGDAARPHSHIYIHNNTYIHIKSRRC